MVCVWMVCVWMVYVVCMDGLWTTETALQEACVCFARALPIVAVGCKFACVYVYVCVCIPFL